MSKDIYIPETLSSRVNDKGYTWVRRLPETVTACTKRWDLRIDEPLPEDYTNMSYSYIAPATRSDGTKVVLKIGSHDQNGKISEQERHVLQLYNGNGTIRLIDSDDDLGTLLLERAQPGIPLAEFPDDEENTRIASRLIKRYRHPVPPKHNFRHTSYEIEKFNRLRKRFNCTTGPLPKKWVTLAETLYDELMATSTESVVLHADLHHWNILSAEREPWLVIDPKGYYGDPGYEVGGYLAVYPDKSCKGKNRRDIDIRRIDIMTEELDMPRERIIKWALVLSVIWAMWDVGNPKNVWREDIARTEVLHSLL